MIHLVINWAPLVGPRAARQCWAWASICELAKQHSDFTAVTVVSPGDPEDVPGYAGTLPRSIGKRNLPFIHDLLDFAAARAADDDWIGFLNSDVALTEGFYQRIQSTDQDLVLCNVTDLKRGDKRYLRRPGYWSIDGLFIRKVAWIRLAPTVPPMVLGAHSWDTAFVLMVTQRVILAAWLGPHECLHQVHDTRHWRRERSRDPASAVNRAALEIFGGSQAVKDTFMPRRGTKIGRVRLR